jgi:ankyrin repeat protein
VIKLLLERGADAEAKDNVWFDIIYSHAKRVSSNKSPYGLKKSDLNLINSIIGLSTYKHDLFIMLIILVLYAFIQDGNTPAIAASYNGHTETLALLLSNKADVNAANNVQQCKIL